MNLPSLRPIALFFSLAFAPSSFVCAQECTSLLVNGDFASTGTGFTSDYIYNNTNSIEGYYAITKNAIALNPYFINLKDHSPSGTTYYMAVNGDIDKNKEALRSTVTIKSGVTYEFSFWIANLHSEFKKANPDTLYAIQPSKVQFTINGQPLIKVNTKPDTEWRHYAQLYTATQDATVVIALRNNANPFPIGGNDFALDDISFRELCMTTGDRSALASEDLFSVYPNPVRSGTLYFGKKASSFRLLTLGNIEILQGTDRDFLSTEGLAKGLYFLRLDNQIFKVLID